MGVSSHRPGKARVDALVARAHGGYYRQEPGEIIGGEEIPGEVVDEVSPARARAALTLEHRRHLAALASDPDAVQSEEAEAGAILEAETACEVHQIAGDLRALVEAHRKR